MSDQDVTVPAATIRRASGADLAQLESLPFSAGLQTKHGERLDRQDRDEVLYVVACQDDAIIGHLLLKWDCPEDPHVRSLIPPCAEVEDFVVAPDRRGAGIGGRMLEFAGSQCMLRGVRRLGIAAGNGNPAARTMYERRGFVPVPGSTHRVFWQAIDESGREIEDHEDCIYLIKELS
jgi:GNAT superfamily N-acetyltransferase